MVMVRKLIEEMRRGLGEVCREEEMWGVMHENAGDGAAVEMYGGEDDYGDGDDDIYREERRGVIRVSN